MADPRPGMAASWRALAQVLLPALGLVCAAAGLGLLVGWLFGLVG